MKYLVRILFLVTFLILCLAGFAFYFTHKRMVPPVDRVAVLQGLTQRVQVSWDHYHVPHILASSESDAIMSMGYIHAQERLWQMTRFQQRLLGKHSELVDSQLLDLDRFYLTLGFAERAQKIYQQLPESDRELLKAYSGGVNRFIEHRERRLPVEFSLAEVRPIWWEPWHVVGVHLLWVWQHHQAFWGKLPMGRIHLSEETDLAHVFTGIEQNQPHLSRNRQSFLEPGLYYELLAEFHRFSRVARPDRITSGGFGFSYTDSDSPPNSLLAVSRETGLSLPTEGFEVIIEVMGNRRQGLTVPGMPLMISGQNGSISWAVKPLALDDGDFLTGDLFAGPVPGSADWFAEPEVEERLLPEITLKRKVVRLKDGSEYPLVVKRAYERPIVALNRSRGEYLAYDWAGFRSGGSDFSALLHLGTLSNQEDLFQRMENSGGAAFQILYSSPAGSGILTGGYTLLREDPLAIRDGADQAELVRAERWFPSSRAIRDRPVFFSGAVQSAGEGPVASLFFPPWNRSDRIEDLFRLSEVSASYPHESHEWLKDNYSSFAARIVPLLADYFEQTSHQDFFSIILPYLNNWDYRVESGSTAATLFELFLIHAVRNLYQDFFDQAELDLLLAAPDHMFSSVSRLIENPGTWPQSHRFSHAQWIIQSMMDAIRYLGQKAGNQPHDWQWGHVAKAEFNPLLPDAVRTRHRSAHLAESRLIQPPSFSLDGAAHTVQGVFLNLSPPFRPVAAATSKLTHIYRGDLVNCSILSSGQSGNFFSPHFNNQFPLWLNSKYRNCLNQQPGISDDSITQTFFP